MNKEYAIWNVYGIWNMYMIQNMKCIRNMEDETDMEYGKGNVNGIQYMECIWYM